ncbi:PAS domain-containing sensor histidine kinase [Leptospira kobayashii]|uniref:histidine kinase n=1 Tax=Leptospira kobayashii TaxID=1917830 RepID=A0ABM7UQG6_9LEPT|nr:PAS domain-containing protein [Leptospira kobayashii]BDA77419.1 PAS domain-containing sensor histidine kinase [Leptospira kobayashii]
MHTAINWLESIFNSIPLPFLEVWGRFGYILGIFIMIAAFGGFTFRPGGRWGFGRERQAWDERAVLSIVFTFILIFVTGFLGSFIVLVPGAQTFESLKDLSVFLCIVLFGYPALIAVPFAYGLSDLIEGVPPEFLGDWILGYFINPSCFWVAYQVIGRDPDFRKIKTWIKYILFVFVFLTIEPVLWGYLCSEQFTSEISYRNITPALFFTTAITWAIAPFAMLVAFPLAKRYGMFWAEIPGHVKELLISYKEWVWESGIGEVLKDINRNEQGRMPIRIFLVTPFIVLVLVMVATTAYLTLTSSQTAADKLACRLHEEISDHIRLRLDNYLNKPEWKNEIPNQNDINRLLWKTSISENGRAFIINRSGMLIASSREVIQNTDQPVPAANSGDLVIRNAVRNLNHNFGNLILLENTHQFRFDIVTAKPLSKETWLTQVSPYKDVTKNIDWLVVTAMPAAYYLEGVRAGNSQSAMVFAIALTLSLLVAVILAGIVATPIQRIASASQAIALGDLSQRVPPSRLEELGALSSSFNHMAEQLHESFHRTKTSEERFRKFAENVQEVFWITTIDKKQLLYINQAYEKVWGRTCESLYADPHTWLDAIHPEDREKARKASASQGIGVYNQEYRILRPDGEIRWIQDNGFAIQNEDGLFDNVIGVARDITEQKKSEEALLSSQRKFRDLVDTTPGIVWEADAVTFTFTFVSQQVENMLGYTVEEWKEPGFWANHLHPDDRERAVEYCVSCTGRLEAHDFEYRFICKDGRVVWLHDLVKVISSDGKAEWLRGVMVDVTERKHIEEAILDLNANLERKIEIRTEELKKSNEDLVLSIQDQKRVMKELEETQDQLLLSEKLAALGQLAAGMTHELNTPLGAIVSSNRAILGILNNELKDIPDFLSGLNEEDSKKFKVILAESLKDATISESLPNRAIKKQFIQSFKSAGIKNYDNLADTVMDLGVYRLGEELTELLNTEKNLEILKAVSSLSTIVRLSNVISVATGKASHVVEALKNYLNPDGNAKEEEITSVDIISEIESILTLYHGKIKYGVEVVKNFLATDRCMGNGNKLNQVWINLLNNGLQSMNYEGRLEIRVEKQDSWIVTSFIDSGTGIADEIKDKIFEPFFTTKKHGEGIGLGLDISKKIVEKLGGKIEFESSPGRTKFSVFLKSASSSI